MIALVALVVAVAFVTIETDSVVDRASTATTVSSIDNFELTFADVEPSTREVADSGTSITRRDVGSAAARWKEVHYDVKPGDTLLRIAASLRIPEEDLLALLVSTREAPVLRDLRPGQQLAVSVRANRLAQLSVSDPDRRLITFSITPPGDGYEVAYRDPALRVDPRLLVSAPPHSARRPVRSGLASAPTAPRAQVALAPDQSASASTRTSRRAGARTVPTNDVSHRRRGKIIKVASGDSLYRIFKRDGYSLATLHHILSSGEEAEQLKRIRPGEQIELRLDDANDVETLVYRPSGTIAISFRREGNQFSTETDRRQYERRVAAATATIESSLFAAASSAGLPDAIAIQLVEIFGWDVDFALDIRRGDELTVLYEELLLDGRVARTGAVIAASFVNQGRTYKAVRYEADGRADYFTPDGERLRRAFIRTPVRFARISSGFTIQRRHPILHTIRAHRGVDYAAPTGTPVRVTGDGRITFIGTKGGYGKTIEVQHGGLYTTLYAHLSGFARDLRSGSRVRQGQTIGFVGSTGLATGPHLHYEFRVSGVHRDPLTVPLPRAGALSRAERARFMNTSAPILKRLASVSESMKLAQAGSG